MFKWNVFLWLQSWIFSNIIAVLESDDPSEMIICRFHVIMNVDNSCYAAA